LHLLGIYLMPRTTKLTVTEFTISVIVVTKMITYRFLRGVLLRMHDRSADTVFHSAIQLALHK